MARKRSSGGRLRQQLVRDLAGKGVIASEAVRDAFLAVPRELFVAGLAAERGLEAVYRDESVVTKRDPQGRPISSSSQPAVMAKMLGMLDPRPGQRVLEIGAGTGYNAALLSEMVGPGGQVTSVEIDPGVARGARRALRDGGYPATVKVRDGRVRHGDVRYDRIIVTACADEIPRAWFDQLADGGRIVLPLRVDPDPAMIQLIPALERCGGRLLSTGLTWGGFMPLHGGDGGWRPPPASVQATRQIRGSETEFVSLRGAGLARLSDATTRKLLAELLGNGRQARAGGLMKMSRPHPPLLLVYLLLKIPAKRRVAIWAAERAGVGLIDPRSGSMAIVSARSPWSISSNKPDARARWRLDAYGGHAAADQLEQLITGWRQLERAQRANLSIQTRVHSDALRLRFAWTNQ